VGNELSVLLSRSRTLLTISVVACVAGLASGCSDDAPSSPGQSTTTVLGTPPASLGSDESTPLVTNNVANPSSPNNPNEEPGGS